MTPEACCVTALLTLNGSCAAPLFYPHHRSLRPVYNCYYPLARACCSSAFSGPPSLLAPPLPRCLCPWTARTLQCKCPHRTWTLRCKCILQPPTLRWQCQHPQLSTYKHPPLPVRHRHRGRRKHCRPRLNYPAARTLQTTPHMALEAPHQA